MIDNCNQSSNSDLIFNPLFGPQSLEEPEKASQKTIKNIDSSVIKTIERTAQMASFKTDYGFVKLMDPGVKLRDTSLLLGRPSIARSSDL